MNPAAGPVTNRSSLRWLWLFVLVLAVVALGLGILARVHRPEPWPGAAGSLLIPVGLIFLAWAGLLPVAKPGARRILIGLSLVCTLAGTVLVALDFFRLLRP